MWHGLRGRLVHAEESDDQERKELGHCGEKRIEKLNASTPKALVVTIRPVHPLIAKGEYLHPPSDTPGQAMLGKEDESFFFFFFFFFFPQNNAVQMQSSAALETNGIPCSGRNKMPGQCAALLMVLLERSSLGCARERRGEQRGKKHISEAQKIVDPRILRGREHAMKTGLHQTFSSNLRLDMCTASPSSAR